MTAPSRTTTRLTSTAAIDTGPSYSPDGSQIVFESDRGGRQQLYVMSADGSGQNRISFGRTKAEKSLTKALNDKADARLDQGRLERPVEGEGGDGKD